VHTRNAICVNALPGGFDQASLQCVEEAEDGQPLLLTVVLASVSDQPKG
jgi:hypothetical protein